MATQTFSYPRHAWISRAMVSRWAWFTLAFLIVVVLEGAVVRATSSGGGCGNHWPLCNGQVFPHHPRLATIIEFTHRSLTGMSSMSLLATIVATFYTAPRRDPARRAAVCAGAFLVGEALLGAALVKFGLVENNASTFRVVMQAIHFTNTLLLLAAVTVTALLLGGTRIARPPASAEMRNAVWSALAATVLTGTTGSLAALADTLFPSPDLRSALAADFALHSPTLIRMRWMHPAAAMVATLATLGLTVALYRRRQTRSASLLAANIAAQIAIGVLDVVLLAPLTLQVLHLLSADLFWISLVAIAVPVIRPDDQENGGLDRPRAWNQMANPVPRS